MRRQIGARPTGPFYFVPEAPGTPEFTDLLVYREDVIGADEVASQADFDEPHWTLEHVLGWIAHRNPRRFRLIAPVDAASSSETSADDWKMTYAFDFVDQDPEGSLRVAFIREQLDGELDRRSLPRGFPNPIPTDWWHDRAMTEVPRMWLRRDSLWPSRPTPRILSVAIAAAETGARPVPKLRAYTELPRMQETIVNIARDLWKDRGIFHRELMREMTRFLLNTRSAGCRRHRRTSEPLRAHSRPSKMRMNGSLGRVRVQSRGRWNSVGVVSEAIVLARVGGFIEGMPEEELSGAPSHPRFGRRKPRADDAVASLMGVRHGHRERRLTGTFGKTALPRSAVISEDGKNTRMMKSGSLRAHQRRTRPSAR
jgi:hypothetical protein